MEYKKLGKTDLLLSAIGLGTFAIGGTMWGGTDTDKAISAIHAAIDQGVTTIDSAPFYGLGLSEELIGEAIKGKDRTKLQLLTKFGMVWDGSNNGKGDFMFNIDNYGQNYSLYNYASKESVVKETEESLKRLDTDYIDLLQIHWNDPTTPIDETMEAMQKLIDQGKILAAGVCNYNAAQMKTAQENIMIASNQVPYSMLTRGVEHEIIPCAVKEKIGIIVYTPLERGLLTGKYFMGARLKPNDHRNDYFNHFHLEKIKTFLDRIEPMANEKNATLAQLVLRWTTLQPGICIVLAGARNAEQAISNANAMAISLNTDEINFINSELINVNSSIGRKKSQIKWGEGGIAIWD
jgi:aryl-alcohol dehydrogenase-like predicted oxidoreductase